MDRKLTTARLVLAVITTSVEEVAIWVIWRWLLPEVDIRMPVFVLVGAMIAWAAFSVWLFVFTTGALKKQAAVGLPSMVGAAGKVASRLSPDGMVRIRGELWSATSNEGDIESGEDIIVLSEQGLKLTVRRRGAKR